jgi:acetyl-CoA C-acetyltransferase
MTLDPRTPILVGVGQTVSHWDGTDVAAAPSPVSLAAVASRAAIADSGASGIADEIDTVVVVRTVSDSGGRIIGKSRCANPPATLAARLGLAPRRLIYSSVGGNQPQGLVNEFAKAVFEGDADVVLLTGAEAIAAQKLAARRGVELDWSDSAEGEMEDRGFGPALLNSYEITNGLGAPTQTYPAFENALRTRLGLDLDAHRHLMSEIWAPFSRVAAANPYAQFPVARDVAFLESVSPENYQIADPYLKWHVAQDAVNMSAAVIVTSVGKAREMGVPEHKWVYLHGHAQVADVLTVERPDLSRSRAMDWVLRRTLASSELAIADMAYVDLYSCFPCAVLIASEAVGLDWRSTTPTVTGGLPFFGGPGNSYSMHAIATMVERLRADPGKYGLVLANGGFLSKEAAGVYSTTPPKAWAPISSADLQSAIDTAPKPTLLSESTQGTVLSYTVTYAKGAPQRAFIIAENEKGRVLARLRGGDTATLAALASEDAIGKTWNVTHEDGVNYIGAA